MFMLLNLDTSNYMLCQMMIMNVPDLCSRAFFVFNLELEAEKPKPNLTSSQFSSPLSFSRNTTIIMSEGTTEKKGKFEPKNPVKLDPPKDDPISAERLAKCDGRQDRSHMPVT